MHTECMHDLFGKWNDAIELVHAVARDVKRGDALHAVELPHVKIVNVQDTIDSFHLPLQRVNVNSIGHELHDDFGHANELREGGI